MKSYFISLVVGLITLLMLFLINAGMNWMTDTPYSSEQFKFIVLIYTFLTVTRVQIEKQDKDEQS